MESQEKMVHFDKIIKDDKPVLVDFYVDWCNPCKTMSSVLVSLNKKFGSKLTILDVDIDKNRRPAAQYHVRSVPTLILFQNGKEKWRKTGLTSLSQLETAIYQHTL